MADKLVLGYWGIRGLAQPIRFLLEYLELPYEDKKYTTMEEWFQGDYIAQPFAGHTLLNLPYIKDGDKYIYESGALFVYLAHRGGKPELLGQTPEEQVRIAQVRGVIIDTNNAFREILRLTKEEFAAKGIETFKANCSYFLDKLNKFLAAKKWAAGENLTTSDFIVFELAETLRHFHNETFVTYENIVRIHAQFADLPQIKNYLTSPRFQERPFYPPQMFAWG